MVITFQYDINTSKYINWPVALELLPVHVSLTTHYSDVTNHQQLHCWFNRLFRRSSKKSSKLRITGLCEGNPPVTGGLPSQRASNAEKSFHLAPSSWLGVTVTTDTVAPHGARPSTGTVLTETLDTFPSKFPWLSIISHNCVDQLPLLLKWVNFNPSMDK